MEHSAHLVDILNEAGEIVGSKPRRRIDKAKDIFHVVYIFLVTPGGELVLTTIPERKDLPNLYAGKLGVPVATIRRTGESSEQAAIRACAREFFIDHAEVHLIGGELLNIDKEKRFVSAFYLVGEPPHVYSKTDLGELIVMSPRELSKRLRTEPQQFSPSLRALWERFGPKLPV